MFEPRIHDPYGLYPTKPYVAHTYDVTDHYPPEARPHVEWLGRFNGENRVRVVSVMPNGTVVEAPAPTLTYHGATLHHGAASPFDAVRTSPIMTMDPLQDPREDIARYYPQPFGD